MTNKVNIVYQQQNIYLRNSYLSGNVLIITTCSFLLPLQKKRTKEKEAEILSSEISVVP